jgi:hypothetical protein
MVVVSSSFLLAMAVACYSSVERLEVMPIMVGKTMVVGLVVGSGKP